MVSLSFTKRFLSLIACWLSFSHGQAHADEWLIGLNNRWSSAVGQIQPSPEAAKVLNKIKDGTFADPADMAEWEDRLIKMVGTGLMGGNRSTTKFAPGIGIPANQMTAETLQGMTKVINTGGAKPGEKVLAAVSNGEDSVEVWTTEGVYLQGHGGGVGRIQKTNYGWSFPSMMLDGKKDDVQTLRFWDLALGNDTMEEEPAPYNKNVIGQLVRQTITRTIEPKATITVFATRAQHTDDVMFLQNECRHWLTRRIATELEKSAQMLAGHAGFRSVKWGTSFEATCLQLHPFLRHEIDSFASSRPTPDLGLFYSKHLATTKTVAKTIDATLWPSLMQLPREQITQDPVEQFGLMVATKHFSGDPRRLGEFIAETGIPVAPTFDYWSYGNSMGRYTAWFIDNQFYALEIEVSDQTKKDSATILQGLAARYGAFDDHPGGYNNSRMVHEDAEGGTLIRYEPRGNEKHIRAIYHYSLKMRPMVNAKLAALSNQANAAAENTKKAAAKKASQF